MRYAFNYKETVQEKVLGVMELFCMLTVVAVNTTQCICENSELHNKNVNFTVCKFKVKIKKYIILRYYWPRQTAGKWHSH